MDHRFDADLTPKELLDHLDQHHDVRPMWRPSREDFGGFVARITERHLEGHHECLPAAARTQHEHNWPEPRVCPGCGGLGNVVAMTLAGDPLVLACPECAGLAIVPASADDELAS